MKYKLLALDLDGTLVNYKNKISKINLKKMKEYIDQGGKICFVTGRTIHYAKIVADQFYNYCKKKVDIICALNGSYIYDNVNNVVLEQNVISNEISNKIKEDSLNKNIVTLYYNKSSIEKKSVYMACNNTVTRFLISSIIKKRIPVLKETHFNTDETFKINLISWFNKKNFIKYTEELSDNYSNLIDLIPTKKHLFEITKKGIDKGYAIRFLEKHFNISKNEFIAMGDSGNDIPMFKEVGLDIAVKDKRILSLGHKPKISLNMSINKALAYVIDNYVK